LRQVFNNPEGWSSPAITFYLQQVKQTSHGNLLV
jgi:hypothetical protein